ncbi:TerB family tellurite resistance protein [Marinibactrum halimedae]|uniref:Co-chaperone DjlA N-terminal domain-containing protein n=2 Tax=Marinibactrum halimedae TaxID=1444977 RepID=A0AA37T4G4_9GAMM|nr:TerB family tellurite resistance protein [Marinibactrum halimedae]GLS26654.1 hypothetical protein GCM10007877_23710 [Marinibactrum halimedae]
MIKKLLDFFGDKEENPDTLPEHACRLASAALLVEVANIDNHFDEKEVNALLRILDENFSLTADELQSLREEAQLSRDNASSLHEFTALINQHFNPLEKYQLTVNMWEIAFADGSLDKYEEYIIRRVSELLYVSHSDFIRAKQQARAKSTEN